MTQGANMAWMTLKEFKAKWGECGELPGGQRWRLFSGSDVCLDGPGCVIATHESQYSGWDAYLTAVGCKPVDPRDAVFKAYGWANQDDKWSHYPGNRDIVRVRKSDGDVNCLLHYTILTAQQAEALCILMGLTKVGEK